jgi:DNA polymerase III subunit beta
MKLTLQRETLLKPLTQVSGVIEHRQIKPILGNVLISIKNQQLLALASNSEIELLGSVALEAEVEDCDEIAVPGFKLIDICRSLPEGEDIKLQATDNKLNVSCKKSRFVLTTLPAKEFPKMQRQEGIISFEVKEQTLKEVIAKTHFVIPQQDVRYYLSGMLLEIKDGILTAVTTDGFRLALKSNQSNAKDNSFAQVIVPRRAIIELMRLLENDESLVKVNLDNNSICVEHPDFTFTSKLIAGKFPNYRKLIPKRGDKEAIIDREAFRTALTRVAILSDDVLPIVNLQFDKNSLQLTTKNPYQEEAVEEMEVDYRKESQTLRLNIKYLLDAVNNLEQEKIRMLFTGSESGIILEEFSDSKDGLYVIMPVRQ